MNQPAPTGPVTDNDRRTLEGALVEAITLLWQGRRYDLLKDIGRGNRSVQLSYGTQEKIRAFAKDRAQKVQDGVNRRIANASKDLPEDATPVQHAAALKAAQANIERYNTTTLIPFLSSWTLHTALVDTATTEPATDGSNRSVAEEHDWVWTQVTDFDDECQAADGESPAPLSDLLGIAGGAPPRHERCQCELTMTIDDGPNPLSLYNH